MMKMKTMKPMAILLMMAVMKMRRPIGLMERVQAGCSCQLLQNNYLFKIIIVIIIIVVIITIITIMIDIAVIVIF